MQIRNEKTDTLKKLGCFEDMLNSKLPIYLHFDISVFDVTSFCEVRRLNKRYQNTFQFV